MIDYKILGKRIKEARLKAGYTQEKLAEKAGLSPDHISHIETAATKLSLPTLVCISNTLKVSTDRLLSDTIYQSKAYLTDDVSAVFSDATSDEAYVMLQAASAVKQSMRVRNLTNKQ